MVQPTWSDWFIREVESVDVNGLSVWYLGANGFIIRTESVTIYIDPYFGIGEHRSDAVRMCPIPMDPKNATRCDAVLVTHEHADHMHPPSYAPLVDQLEATIHAPQTCFVNPDYDDQLRIPEFSKSVIEPGESFNIGDLGVSVFDANDADAIEPVSFVIEHESGTFYHGGDTKYSDRLNDIGERFDITLAAFAFGTVGQYYRPEEEAARPARWYMNGDEIIKATNALCAERLVPTHYDLWKGFEADPKILHDHATTFRYPRVIEIARVGDRLDIDHAGVVPPEWAQ